MNRLNSNLKQFLQCNQSKYDLEKKSCAKDLRCKMGCSASFSALFRRVIEGGLRAAQPLS